MNEDPFEKPPVENSFHPWKARFLAGLTMIVLSFIGLVLSNIWPNDAWNYWRVLAVLFGVLCIFLSIYLRKKEHSFSFVKLSQEILHFLTLLFSVFLLSLFVKTGMMGRFQASLAILTATSLIIFLAGIYIESSFLLIGIALGLFSIGSAYLTFYLYTIMLPIALLAIGGLFLLVYLKKKDRDQF